MIAALFMLMMSNLGQLEVRCSDLHHIEQLAKAQGNAAFLRSLAMPQWMKVLDCIGDGDAGWIRFAAELAPDAHTALSEDIGISLAFALPENASTVLSVLSLSPDGPPSLRVRRVCSLPFIEDTMPDGYEGRALSAVRNAKIVNEHIRKECLSELQQRIK